MQRVGEITRVECHVFILFKEGCTLETIQSRLTSWLFPVIEMLSYEEELRSLSLTHWSLEE